MRSGPDDPDFTRFLATGAFLHRLGLGAPAIFATRPEEFSVLMEDLGDDTLCRLVRDRRRANRAAGRPAWHGVDALYRRVLDHLAKMQVKATAALSGHPPGLIRDFDFAYLRWETDYFRHHLLDKVLGRPARELAALDQEFDDLAGAALAQPQVFIHRDFQSQNILLQAGGGRRVRLVDFQGARRGQVAYDLMSLVRDPYVALPLPLQRELIEHFRRALARAGGPAYPPAKFAAFTVVAALQRGMQALGAYGFLSRVKGKPRYAR
jgi:aminoglycoside/choline kinase family phosphotransferase